jgi:hypothetical protein
MASMSPRATRPVRRRAAASPPTQARTRESEVLRAGGGGRPAATPAEPSTTPPANGRLNRGATQRCYGYKTATPPLSVQRPRRLFSAPEAADDM